MVNDVPKSEPRASVRKQLNAVDKQVHALELRKSGHTFEQIAAKLGYASKSGASKAVHSALKKTIQEPADELRQLEMERMDALLAALWPQAMQGSPRHAEMCLKIMDRRAAMIGLDAPKQVEDHRMVTIQILAEQMAERAGMDSKEVIAEAERIIADAAIAG